MRASRTDATEATVTRAELMRAARLIPSRLVQCGIEEDCILPQWLKPRDVSAFIAVPKIATPTVIAFDLFSSRGRKGVAELLDKLNDAWAELTVRTILADAQILLSQTELNKLKPR